LNESTIFIKKNNKMKKFLLAICIAIGYTGVGQCEDGRYQDLIFPSVSVESNILYGNNINYLGVDTDLSLDVYTPEGDIETLRPLIMFAHGGSFIGGSKTGPDVVPFCRDFARMGYATASIQYRLGIPFTFELELPATEAVVRGYHDMKAAIRYMRKTVAEDGNPHGIDSDKIYVVGVSAGGFIALHLAYMDDEAELPEILDLTVEGLTGGLAGDSGNSGYSSEVNAIVNICGAIGDAEWINSDDEPVLSFHGPFDTVVPYGSEELYLFGSIPVLDVDGSATISDRADEVGVLNCFEIYEDQGHVPHVDNAQFYDTTRAIMSSFLSHLVCPEIALDCEYSEVIDLSISSVSHGDKFEIYPNPTSELLIINFPVASETSEIRILDALGREVERLSISPLSESTELNVSTFKEGYYTCLWIKEGQVEKRKLLIMR
jgi:para-nitrobenzyl esterase